MKSLAALAALTIALASTALPAAARDSFVIDNAHLLSAAAVAQINAKVADFNAISHKEVVVDIEPSITEPAAAAAEHVFAQQQVNGVLIFVAKSPKTIYVGIGHTDARFFPAGSAAAIRKSIQASFNSGDFNGGINNGVDLTLSMYRSHLNSLPRTHAYAPSGAGASVRTSDATGGFHMSWIVWLIVLAIIFFVIRGIFRAIAGPRMTPPGYGGGPMGGGYGPGYGGGGFGGGGGGFWSGMLGGLGGAFLGNELFGGNRDRGFGGNEGGFVDPNAGGNADSSGWQSDAGQMDAGSSSGGGWGDSGGGGGDSGGWGGGGGGDFGGGGGDSGGGW